MTRRRLTVRYQDVDGGCYWHLCYQGFKVNGGLSASRARAAHDAMIAIEHLVRMNGRTQGQYLRDLVEAGGL